MRRLYSFLLSSLLPLFLLRLWWRGFANPAYRERWRERLGRYATPSSLTRPLWIHAVSVGEVGAAGPLIKALRAQHPALPILITTTTPTGFDTVERVLGVDFVHAYFPYDYTAAVARFVAHFAPRALVLMETELWPNVIYHSRRRGLPVFLVNGRLAEKSTRRYARLGSLVREMVGALSGAAMQTTNDRARLCELGADPARVEVTGSLKFDVAIPASIFEEAAALRRDLGAQRPILMAGSTRPGEEALLLGVCRALKAQFDSLLLILAPRHPERFAEVAELCRKQGLTLQTRQHGTRCVPEIEIFLLDTMGEMTRFYAASDVAFVGGSLVPLGGHNLLEPAALGVPVVAGPHLFNFAEIAQKLSEGGALSVGQNAADITAHVAALLDDSDARDHAGCGGRAIVEANRGATARVLAMLSRHPDLNLGD